MILRRLMQHVKEQNWLAVGLDFVIVVTGVFIGIQVSNWNDAQGDKLKESQIRERLAEDLRADLEELNGHEWFTRRRFASAEALVNRITEWRMPEEYPTDFGEKGILERPDIEWPDDAGDALYFSQRFTIFHVEQRTYRSIISAGDLANLEDQTLLEDLRSYYLGAVNTGETEEESFRIAVENLRQLLSEYGLTYYEPIDWPEIDAIISADPKFLGLLKTTAYEAAVQLAFIALHREEAEALIERLEVQQ